MAVVSAGCVELVVAACLYRRFRQTTLRAPLVWAAISCLALTAIGLIVNSASLTPAVRSHLAYLAAVSTFCPLMAVLGAKRPQDRAWQFIVAALYLVLALPSAETLLAHPDRALELHPARQWFLVVLIGVGWCSFLPTRHGWAGLLSGCGQLMLLHYHLPWIANGPMLPLNMHTSYAGGCLMLGLSSLVYGIRALRTTRPMTTVAALNQTWLDFRDAFGLLWGLRVAERFNATAVLLKWPVRIRWAGLVDAASGKRATELSAETTEAIRQFYRGTLWRFVSEDWLNQRLDHSARCIDPSEAINSRSSSGTCRERL